MIVVWRLKRALPDLKSGPFALGSLFLAPCNNVTRWYRKLMRAHIVNVSRHVRATIHMNVIIFTGPRQELHKLMQALGLQATLEVGSQLEMSRDGYAAQTDPQILGSALACLVTGNCNAGKVIGRKDRVSD